MSFRNHRMVRMLVPFLVVFAAGSARAFAASPEASGAPWFASKDAIVTCMDIGEVRALGDELASALLQGLPMLGLIGLLSGADLDGIESYCIVQKVTAEGFRPEVIVVQGDLDGSLERMQGVVALLPVSAPTVRRVSNGVQVEYDDLDGTRAAFVVLEDRVAIYGEREPVERAVHGFRAGAQVGFRGSLMGVRIDSMSPIVRVLVGAPSVVRSVEETASVSDDRKRLVVVTRLRTGSREHALLVRRLLAEQRASQDDPYSKAGLGGVEGALPKDARVEVDGNDVRMVAELPIQVLAAALGGSMGNLLGGAQVEL